MNVSGALRSLGWRGNGQRTEVEDFQRVCLAQIPLKCATATATPTTATFICITAQALRGPTRETRHTALLMLVAIAFGIEAARALSVVRGALEGGTELDVDL